MMETLSRLRSAGVEMDETADPDDLARLLDAVERFEAAVRACGGDLMVDQPPVGHEAQPDDPRFVLPKRNSDESVSAYRLRILDAAERLT
jgi:hypothetical protein